MGISLQQALADARANSPRLSSPPTQSGKLSIFSILEADRELEAALDLDSQKDTTIPQPTTTDTGETPSKEPQGVNGLAIEPAGGNGEPPDEDSPIAFDTAPSGNDGISSSWRDHPDAKVILNEYERLKAQVGHCLPCLISS